MAATQFDALRNQIEKQATCLVCLELVLPLYGCDAGTGCTAVTCGSCRELEKFDRSTCPVCRGKQRRGGTRNLLLEANVRLLNLVDREPAAPPATARHNKATRKRDPTRANDERAQRHEPSKPPSKRARRQG